MKRRFYQFVQIAVLLILSSFSALALDNAIIENYRSTVVRDNEGKVQRYSVLVSNVGEPKNNSDFSEHFVQRVSPRYYAKGRIYVKTKAKTDKGAGELLQAAGALKTDLQSIGSTKITVFADAKQVAKNPGMQKYGLDRLYKISIPLDKDPFEVCAELMQNPDVEYACPVSVAYKFEHKPNDPMIGKQYALESMMLFDAWDVTKGSPDVKIAIVDSGTDFLHPDLADNIWTNPNEIADDGIDNDGNGKIDDIHGWDFAANDDIEELLNKEYKEDNDPRNSVQTHGTMVAGCSGAVPNNNEGIAGTGYNCKIIPIKVGTEIQAADGIYQVIEAVKYAAELGADVINCSWGTPAYSPAEQDLVNYITLEKKALIVAAAGNETNDNDNNPLYPTSYKNVLSVGAVDSNDEITEFSNYGFAVHTYAPGGRVYTTNVNGGYKTTDGTSFSSPYVAGVAALVKSVHPDWSPLKILHQIKSTSDIIENDNTPGGFFGRTNALKAVTYNSDKSEKTVPGIGVEKFFFTNEKEETTITDYKEKSITIELKNYLASTKDLAVKVSSLDGYLNIKEDEFTIAQIDENGTATIELNATISEICPWSEGFLAIGLEFTGEDGEYKALDLVRVPIKLPTDAETMNVEYELPVMLFASNSYDINKAWAAGFSQTFTSYACKFNAETEKVNFFQLGGMYMPRALAAIDDNIAYVVAINMMTGLYEIVKTDDGGKTFKPQTTNNITAKISGLLFKDKNNGLVIGDAANGEWRIGTTENGGKTWEKIENFPKAQSVKSNLLENAIDRVNDCIFFATTDGSVYKSNDFGKTWSAKAPIPGTALMLSFLNENEGMVISYSNASLNVLATTNGGDAWKKVGSFLPIRSIGLTTKLFADRRSNALVIASDDGAIFRTDNLGESWKPILKPKSSGKVMTSSLFANENGDVSVFLLGQQAERVKYKAKKSSVETVSSNYNLTPNPAANSCELFLGDDASKVEAMEIYSADGRLVMQLAPNFNSGSTTINTSSLPVGQYNILLMGKGIRETVKLIIVR